MPLYRNACYWFVGLLIILILGFWRTYFSQLGHGDVNGYHHFHGIIMLAWVLLLILQSWFIRNRKNAQHRTFGRLSFFIAPLVVISGLLVTFYSQAQAPDPAGPIFMAFLWLGLFSALVFGLLYFLAIHYRRNVQLHARYMASTALVFLTPGLARVASNYGGFMGDWAPTFVHTLWVPLLIGLWLMIADIRKRADYRPWLVFNLLWGFNLVQWTILPRTEFWKEFAIWSAANLG